MNVAPEIWTCVAACGMILATERKDLAAVMVTVSEVELLRFVDYVAVSSCAQGRDFNGWPVAAKRRFNS